MRELALNVLDIAENSLAAGAKLIGITLDARFRDDVFSLCIEDDGCGMDAEMLARVTDPFTTTRTTRKVGMGLPLFKFSAESTGGRFEIRSEKGKGTRVFAEYRISHIDRIPLGDFGGVVLQLITMNPEVDFVVRVRSEETEGELVRAYIKEYIQENLVTIYGGRL